MSEYVKKTNNPRMGRPTSDPKDYRVTARVTASTKRLLDLYCEKNNITTAEALTRGIYALAKKDPSKS